MAAEADPAFAALHQRLDRYPADRFPVQHATTCFHLGTLHLQRGQLADAVDQLSRAVDGFTADGLTTERAKAMNMLGIAHRERGELDAASRAFAAAVEGFAAAGEVAQRAAAAFNLGLVARQQGTAADAVTWFRTALDGFRTVDAHLQASAAGRELGVCLLEDGHLDTAASVLEAALGQADAAGDATAVGAAANALGLARLAADRHAEAADAFRRAAGTHPRRLRPAQHAMATANLALALEPVHPAAAAVAARQAAGVPTAPETAVDQAQSILTRLDRDALGAEDLLAVLADEPPEAWGDRWRDEHPRLLDADATVLTAETAAFLQGALARSEVMPEHLAAWVDAVLDLPPRPMEALLASLLLAVRDLDAAQVDIVRSVMGRVLPRFPMPQWMRLKDTLNGLAERLGEPGGWG